MAIHSVEVIGMLYPNNDSEHPKVILNDPGIDNGKGVMIPIEQFEKAWATSDHLIASVHSPNNHTTVLKDNQDPSQIIASAGFGNANRSLHPDPYDNQQQRDAKSWANQYERNLAQQNAAREEREHFLKLERQEAQRQEEMRREEQRREEQRREEAFREQQQRERELQQREEQMRAEQRREEILREEQQKEQQRWHDEEQAQQRKTEELKAQQHQYVRL
ncbi:MAG: hypothetical protein VSS75_016160 [Candidatus Parabeggiatoa sp.]|nr:hypothetical protein [Candidatus Parabeggiatoa sp.]